MDIKRIERLEFCILKYKEYMVSMNFAASSIKRVDTYMKYFVEFLAKNMVNDIGQVTVDTISKYQMHLYNNPGIKGRVLGINSQRDILVGLRSFFRFLLKKGYLMYDPANALEIPKCPDRLPRGIMTKKEINRILSQPDVETPHGLRDKAMLELFYSCGIRYGELKNLRMMDIDLSNREVRINNGKGGKDRVVPAGEIACKYVEEYLRSARPALVKEAESWIKEKLDTDILFVNRNGKKYDHSSINRNIRMYVAKAKVRKHISSHCFRHTCATHMLKSGANIRHVQEMLGHGSLSTTQIYTRVEVGDLKRVHRKCHPREQPISRERIR